MCAKFLELFSRRCKLQAQPPKQIRFVDADGNPLFYLPDGSSIAITCDTGEQLVQTCRYVGEEIAEIGGTERDLWTLAEEWRRNGATFSPEITPEYEQGYRIIRKMPVPNNTIALGHDPAAPWPYVTLERSPIHDGYDYPRYYTECWQANQDFARRVLEWQRGKPPRHVGPVLQLKKRGDAP
jgi:hypothetical protein